MARTHSIDIGGVQVPRLAFGIGSLMKWNAQHTGPIPTDSTKEVQQAVAAGFRHFNTGDLYINNESAANVLKASGLPRDELFLSMKLNTYALIGCTGADSMVESLKKELKRYDVDYVDLLQLHFPPRGFKNNLTNRESWRVLEKLKDEGLARTIGVSNWALSDYESIMNAPDLKYKPQVNELEHNVFLNFDPEVTKLRKYEEEHGVVNMSKSTHPLPTESSIYANFVVDYGVLTIISGKLANSQSSALTQELEKLSEQTGLSPAELLLSWAYDTLDGIVVTSTSNADRASRIYTTLAGDSTPLSPDVIAAIEKAAEKDGPEDKIFYKHPHMKVAAAQ